MTRPLLVPVNALLQAIGYQVRRLGRDILLENDNTTGGSRTWHLLEYSAQLQLRQILESNEVSCVLDVGANDGGFARHVRGSGWGGTIVSFEPQTRCREQLARQVVADGSWRVLPYALSDEAGSVELTLRESTHLVSLHTPNHTSNAQQALGSRTDFDTTGTEQVLVRRLDELHSEIPELQHGRLFLKIDTQGHDDRVLAGAAGILPRVFGIQVELSQVPLYEGTLPFTKMIETLGSLGFGLAGITPVLFDPSSGVIIECDGVFLRTNTMEAVK